MPYCGNMISAHTVDDLGYALADADSQREGRPIASPNILPFRNLDFQGKNRSVSNRDAL
jgi:hypothetical protein